MRLQLVFAGLFLALGAAAWAQQQGTNGGGTAAVACSQLPATTGNVTHPAGSCNNTIATSAVTDAMLSPSININTSGKIATTNATNSTSTTTGALTVTGGVGIGNALTIGGVVSIGPNFSSGSFNLGAADSGAIAVIAGGTRAIRFGADGTSAYWEAVDVTGVASFQPLVISGSTFTLRTGAGATTALSIDGSQNATLAANLTITNLATDATHTDRTVCQDTTSKTLFFGSGAAGICLGTSSLRFKTDVHALAPGLREVLALEPISFQYKPGYGGEGIKYGFAAEQVAEVIPELVGRDPEGRVNTVDWAGVVPVLVNAIRQQQREIAELREAIKR